MRVGAAAQAAALTGYFGLLVLLTAWHGWLAPSPYFPVAITLAMALVPLLFPLRGLLHGRVHTYQWTPYLALLYFAHGTAEAVVNAAERLWAGLEILFSLLLLTGAAIYARTATRAG